MVIRTASPSVNINEVDLTRGTIDAISTNVGAFAGPFEKGPVGVAVLVNTESELQRIFGNPTDENYEYWWTVNNFLEYGGVCYVVRCDDSVGDSSGTGLQKMKNAADVVGTDGLGPYIKNTSDFEENFQWGTVVGGATEARFIANSPGEWGNSLGVSVIDRGADFQLLLNPDAVTELDTGNPTVGGFGETVVGSINTISNVSGGTGFVSGATLPIVGGAGTGATVEILSTANSGPVSSIGEITAAGAGYRDANNLATTGGSGFGLTVDILANDNGPATAIGITSAINNYRFSLIDAALSEDAINVALGTSASASGTGAVILGTFTDNILTAVRVSVGLGGTGYSVGEVLTIATLNGTAVDILDTDTTLTVTEVNINGAIQSATLRSAGIGYKAGDIVDLVQTGSTSPGRITVNSVESTGAIVDFQVIDPGQNYVEGNIVTITTPGGRIATLGTLTPGSGYAPGVYNSVPLTGGAGTGAVATIIVDSGGLVDSVIITDGGKGYAATNPLSASNSRLGGIGSGFSVLVSTVAGTNASFRITDVNEANAKLPSGSLVGSYYRVVAPNGLSFSTNAYVEECNALGVVQDATGHVISGENGSYRILSTGGLFGPGSYLTTDGGTTVVGPITAVYKLGDHILYGVSEESNYVVSTIFKPQTYTVTEAFDVFGWPEVPSLGQKSPLSGAGAYGDTFVYDSDLQLWRYIYNARENDLIVDASYVYRVQVAEDWYDQQIAYQGVPWYRFAPRPSTTRFALERGAIGDGLNILIYDATGDLTGSRGNILESYIGVSKLSGARTIEGENNYYIDVINQTSSYVWANKPLEGNTHKLLNLRLADVGSVVGDGVECSYIDQEAISLKFGENNLSVTLGEIQDGYRKFADESFEDLDYIMQGPGFNNLNDSIAKANFIISIVESKKSCMAFLSPPRFLVVGRSDSQAITDGILEWAKEVPSSSYTFMDSGYKYSYDRFNDVYRYMPLNGDIAGDVARTSIESEPWLSPAGISRGQIYNVVRLAYNPSKQQRDQLYANRVNPVVTFPGEGTILYGDKTALGYTSAFDRINVRRLFLVVQKAIAESSRSVLFEFNDEVTRSLFKNNVNPYLRDVQSKRGMQDFLMVCDSSNNTPEIIDRNEFVADIYIKPNRSVNYIRLNFVATKTGVTFDESVALFRGTNGAINR
jgi:hypothetical protein